MYGPQTSSSSITWELVRNEQINQPTKQKALIDTDNSMLVSRGEGGGGRLKRVKGVQYKGAEGDSILGGEHTLQLTGDIL